MSASLLVCVTPFSYSIIITIIIINTQMSMISGRTVNEERNNCVPLDNAAM